MSTDLVLRCPSCGSDALADDEFCETCGFALGVLRDAHRNHFEVDAGTAAGVSDRGLVHLRNEDALFLEVIGASTVAVVCDGVSTSVAPQVAAQIGAQTSGSLISAALRRAEGSPQAEQVLLDALAAANGAVIDVPWEPRRGREGPSCTIVATVWDGDLISAAWSGDSRAYWVGHDRAIQLTSDHSWAQALLDAGRVRPQEALADPRAHAITRWLGPDAPEVVPPVASFRPVDGGRLVVCSDGLWNHLDSTQELGSIVTGVGSATPPIGVARALIRHALGRGGSDNVTVVVVNTGTESHDREEPST